MARATFVKSAQKDIYTHGKRVEYISEKGKRIGQTKSKLDRTIPADENDTVFIAKGQSYYWWQFMNGGKNFSLTYPKRSQLTQSGFLSQLYDLEDKIGSFSADNKDDFDSFKSEVLDEITEMKDQCEESKSSMPEHLQEVGSGETLTERIDALDSWHSEIDSVECDYDEDDLRTEIKEEDDSLSEDEIESALAEKIQEKVDEAISSIQDASSGL